MRSDKKVRDGRLTFILARGIGSAFVSRTSAKTICGRCSRTRSPPPRREPDLVTDDGLS